nr:hypothetical protein Iba_chr08eCG8930 [Ipomoea batatas]
MIFAAAGNCRDDKREHGETQADRRKEAELRRKMAAIPTAFATKVKRTAAGDTIVSVFTNISAVLIGTASINTALPSSCFSIAAIIGFSGPLPSSSEPEISFLSGPTCRDPPRHDKGQNGETPANERNESELRREVIPDQHIKPKENRPHAGLLHNGGDPGARLAEQQAVPDGGAPRHVGHESEMHRRRRQRVALEKHKPRAHRNRQHEHRFSQLLLFHHLHNRALLFLAAGARDFLPVPATLEASDESHDVHNFFGHFRPNTAAGEGGFGRRGVLSTDHHL